MIQLFPIYLFTVWTHGCGYLFYTSSDKPILCYCVAQIALALATGNSVASCNALIHTHYCVVVVNVFLLSALQGASGLFCVFFAPVLESAIFPKSPGSIRNENRDARCTHCYWVQGHSADRARKYMCVY